MRELWSKTSAQWIMAARGGLTLLFLGLNLNGALGQLTKLQIKEQALQRETERLTQEIARLKKEIQQIKSDPSVYIDEARNQYLYLKPEEKLTVLLKQDKRTAGQPDSRTAGQPEGRKAQTSNTSDADRRP